MRAAETGGERHTAWKDAEEMMMQTLKSERGMSLVEATIILAILATLTAVIAPSMGDYLEDARAMKTKEDVEALGMGLQRILRDTGFKALRVDGAVTHTLANRLDVVVSAGLAPAVAGGNYTPGATLIENAINWDALPAGNNDTFEEQLVINGTTAYVQPTTFNTRGKGWRGAYVNIAIGADPWGNRYAANTVFLASATDAAAGTGEGQLSGGWAKDVIVASAGPDGIMQALIEGTAGYGSGVLNSDDVIFVLQGNSR